MGTEPLNDTEWSRFWEYLSTPQLPAEQMSPEQKQQALADHAEFAALHDKAQAYIDEWRPDEKAVTTHLVGVIQHFVSAIETLANILPAAGNLMARLPVMKGAVENLSVALRGPAQIPPMPAPPAEVPPPTQQAPPLEGEAQQQPAWPTEEQKQALDPSTKAQEVGATDGGAANPPQPDHA